MAYYTEEDRERAAAKRKLNSQFRQLIKSPEDAFDILGIPVPRITSQPTLNEFGLSDDIEERLKNIDADYIRREKSYRIVIALIATTILIYLFVYVTNLGGLLSVGGLFGVFWLWARVLGVEPEQTHEHSQYKKYKEQLSYYEYWQRKNNKDHWNKMTGHGKYPVLRTHL